MLCVYYNYDECRDVGVNCTLCVWGGVMERLAFWGELKVGGAHFVNGMDRGNGSGWGLGRKFQERAGKVWGRDFKTDKKKYLTFYCLFLTSDHAQNELYQNICINWVWGDISFLFPSIVSYGPRTLHVVQRSVKTFLSLIFVSHFITFKVTIFKKQLLSGKCIFVERTIVIITLSCLWAERTGISYYKPQ